MSEDRQRLPMYQRADKPPPVQLTKRDLQIFEKLHAFDNVMSAQQIQRSFFSGERAAKRRLSLLFHGGYLQRSDRQQHAQVGSIVYWLDRKAAQQLAELKRVPFGEFKYRQDPRWSLVRHDLIVNDFRLDVVEAAKAHTEIELEQWVPGGEFWAHPDTVEYPASSDDDTLIKRKVRPDGFFVLVHSGYRQRLLLEIDMSTEDNPRFGREKVRPGIAYLRSQAYKDRFGYRSGRWLVVTTGDRRLGNMKRQTEVVGRNAAGVFHFTTFDRVGAGTVLTKPIWYKGGSSKPQALVNFKKK